ncbi:MAG: hypothetical protein R2939_19815 [Kofleriaceae bacterium]
MIDTLDGEGLRRRQPRRRRRLRPGDCTSLETCGNGIRDTGEQCVTATSSTATAASTDYLEAL